jgi:hypothetical protein
VNAPRASVPIPEDKAASVFIESSLIIARGLECGILVLRMRFD